MKLVIDIPEALKDRIDNANYNLSNDVFTDCLYQADIKNLFQAVKYGKSFTKQ